MKFKGIRYFFGFILASMLVGSTIGLTSCGPKEQVCGSNEEYETPITDAFKFDLENVVSNNNFLTATTGLAISEVKVIAYTDGDTTNFSLVNGTGGENDRFRLRYEGIDTPESTGEIDPWGLKASLFTKTKLKSATSIVVVNDLVQFEKYDSSGGRYMGFVWYKTENSDYRLLNLEIVEQGYSLNYLQQSSALLPRYFEAFKEAGEAAKKANRRVNGEADCDYDDSGEVVETTIANAKENFDTLGVDYNTSSGGKKLRITAIITGVAGYNFYCRDLTREDTDETYSGIYAFTQYKSIDLKPGYIVKFYCKITKYSGNYQLTDIETSTIASRYAFEYVAKTKEEVEELGYEYDVDAYKIPETSITKYSDFEKYTGNYVEIPLTVHGDRNNPDAPYYESTTTSGGQVFTILTYYGDMSLNIRCESHSFFSDAETISIVFEVGKTYSIKAFVGCYQYDEDSEIEYQLSLPSFRDGYQNYIQEVTE